MVYAGAEFIEERRGIAWPVRVPICGLKTWKLSPHELGGVLQSEVEHDGASAEVTEPVVAEVHLNLDGNWSWRALLPSHEELRVYGWVTGPNHQERRSPLGYAPRRPCFSFKATTAIKHQWRVGGHAR